jgi:octanoyl-[GcvH]:protein N-octanoyltransferase
MHPFGGPFCLIDDTDLPAEAQPSPAEYAAWVQQQLASLRLGEPGVMRLRRPQPTAAFSPQDTTHPDYESIKVQVRANGFEPIERGTGGRLTMFDEKSLAITLVSPHADPYPHMTARYDLFAGAIAEALGQLGIDARVGELPHEYCPGKYSINAGGRVKLVGIAQRMNKCCFQMGAIIAVERSDKACAAITQAYHAMGLPFDASTYGAIADARPEVGYGQLRAQLTSVFKSSFQLISR